MGRFRGITFSEGMASCEYLVPSAPLLQVPFVMLPYNRSNVSILSLYELLFIADTHFLFTNLLEGGITVGRMRQQ